MEDFAPLRSNPKCDASSIEPKLLRGAGRHLKSHRMRPVLQPRHSEQGLSADVGTRGSRSGNSCLRAQSRRVYATGDRCAIGAVAHVRRGTFEVGQIQVLSWNSYTPSKVRATVAPSC